MGKHATPRTHTERSSWTHMHITCGACSLVVSHPLPTHMPHHTATTTAPPRAAARPRRLPRSVGRSMCPDPNGAIQVSLVYPRHHSSHTGLGQDPRAPAFAAAGRLALPLGQLAGEGGAGGWAHTYHATGPQAAASKGSSGTTSAAAAASFRIDKHAHHTPTRHRWCKSSSPSASPSPSSSPRSTRHVPQGPGHNTQHAFPLFLPHPTSSQSPSTCSSCPPDPTHPTPSHRIPPTCFVFPFSLQATRLGERDRVSAAAQALHRCFASPLGLTLLDDAAVLPSLVGGA